MPVPNVQWKTPDDEQRNCPNHVEFLEKINWEISGSVGFIIKKFVTMHGHTNVKINQHPCHLILLLPRLSDSQKSHNKCIWR